MSNLKICLNFIEYQPIHAYKRYANKKSALWTTHIDPLLKKIHHYPYPPLPFYEKSTSTSIFSLFYTFTSSHFERLPISPSQNVFPPSLQKILLPGCYPEILRRWHFQWVGKSLSGLGSRQRAKCVAKATGLQGAPWVPCWVQEEKPWKLQLSKVFKAWK